MLLRRELWRRGVRYRLGRRVHGTRPDLTFSRAKLAVFVDGCFWHGCPIHYRSPVGNAGYWRGKVVGNQARDERNNVVLLQNGWSVLRLWACEVERDPVAAADLVMVTLKSAQCNSMQAASGSTPE